MSRSQVAEDALAIVGAATVLTFVAGVVVSAAIVAGQWVRNRNRAVRP